MFNLKNLEMTVQRYVGVHNDLPDTMKGKRYDTIQKDLFKFVYTIFDINVKFATVEYKFDHLFNYHGFNSLADDYGQLNVRIKECVKMYNSLIKSVPELNIYEPFIMYLKSLNIYDMMMEDFNSVLKEWKVRDKEIRKHHSKNEVWYECEIHIDEVKQAFKGAK